MSGDYQVPGLWRVRRLFWGGAFAGAALVLSGLVSPSGHGFLPRLGLVIAGLGLLVGCGGTLILSYGKATDSDVFPMRVMIRAGFLMMGPGAVVAELPGILKHGPWACLAGCALTVLPFGVALAVLLIRRKQKKK